MLKGRVDVLVLFSLSALTALSSCDSAPSSRTAADYTGSDAAAGATSRAGADSGGSENTGGGGMTGAGAKTGNGAGGAVSNGGAAANGSGSGARTGANGGGTGSNLDGGVPTGPDTGAPVPIDAGVVDFCAGHVTDKNSRAPTTAPRPAVGTWITDSDFGSQVMRITDSADGDATTPMYSTIPAWNADGSLLLLYHWGDGHVLYDGRTFARIGSLDCMTSDGWNPSPSDVEHVMWDPKDPNIVHFPSRYAPDNRGPLPLLFQCNVRTHQATIQKDFSGAPTSCAAGKDELTMGGDPQWFPSPLVGLQCGYDVSDTKWSGRKWIYDMVADRVYTPRSGAPFTDSVAPIAGPSGRLAYYSGAVYDLNLTMQRSLGLASVDEHANIGRSMSGHDIYFAVDFNGKDPGVIIAHDMDTGKAIPLISQSLGWGYPASGIHITSIAADPRAIGWAMASIIGETPSDTLAEEFVLANVDTHEVCRVGRHHSRAGNGGFGYQAEPHPAFHILSDGTLEAVFGSDWGGQNRADTYILRLKP